MKLQKNTKWGNVLDRTDMGTRFITGIKSTIEESEDEGSALPKKPGSTLGKIIGAKQRTLESISSINEPTGPPGSVISRARRGTVTSISEDDSEPTKPLKTGILGKLKGVLEAPIIDESNERSIRTPAKPAFRSKQLYPKDQTIEPTDDTSKKPDQTEKSKLEVRADKGTLQDLIDKLDNLKDENPSQYWALLHELSDTNRENTTSDVSTDAWFSYFKNLNEKDTNASCDYLKDKIKDMEREKIFTELDNLISKAEIEKAIRM
ncbi:unnamed protein product [Mytilus edulis]|uniref:Uncharacterized protein n=1 Tax=Mytilus edulis TaxID=6550 RepID=A0A8S3S5B4_MYTED|nr:unnamed protein product [Mytilus edulis]